MPTLKEVFGTSPVYWNTAKDGQKLMVEILAKEGDLTDGKYYHPENALKYYYSALAAIPVIGYNYAKKRYIDKGETDKYKHAYINCRASQLGAGGYDLVEFLAGQKEKDDVNSGGNTQDASIADNYANRIGKYLGSKYPDGDCDEMLGKHIKRYW